MRISLAKLWMFNHEVLASALRRDMALCEEYSCRPIEKPIELVPGTLTILDGRHRCVAATMRGDHEIEVVVR